MNIREATFDDVSRIVEFGREFYKSTRYVEDGIPYNAEQAQRIVEALLGDNGFILVLDDGEVQGFCMMMIVPFIWDPAYLTAIEAAYYVTPDCRKAGWGTRLLSAVDSECQRRGCRYVSMISMETSMPEAVGKLYETLGFQRTETTYTRDLDAT
jgi:L-amino acid N-acyltransferase YncA